MSANVPAVALDAVIGPAVSDPVPALAVPDAPSLEPVAEPEPAWREFRVRSGDSLALIFKREKLRASDLQAVLDGGPETKRLRRIHPGEVLQYSIDDDGRLLALRYEFSALEAMEARRDDAEAPFTAVLVQREPEHRIAYSQGVIDSSLFLACTRAGLDDGTAMKLADIFQWDIDFVLEIRQGDSFDLVFEELWLDGKKIGNGAILAAEFVNQGERYRAVRYTDTSGYTSYYTPEGMSMRKAFLRAPVDFSRISSNFNPRRLHPVWKTVRPHRGIDYAAPSGTPVKAAGDGKVVTVTSNGPSGNFVVLQHGESYQTKYLHLSRFARGMKRNKRVSQGDIIGYVGATGWATAPHLHYEFLVHGVHQNPRTVDLPKALPIADAERTRFMSSTRETVARLDALRDDEQIALAAGQATNGG
ncbi:MAG TPA: peptidoglycan DD-metalloendopeptidase family protein [Pseudomonadales bacterium]|nr:peptidoglycan DD-metalloendopeptidase family protein [Pseudomonadales bacterium]